MFVLCIFQVILHWHQFTDYNIFKCWTYCIVLPSALLLSLIPLLHLRMFLILPKVQWLKDRPPVKCYFVSENATVHWKWNLPHYHTVAIKLPHCKWICHTSHTHCHWSTHCCYRIHIASETKCNYQWRKVSSEIVYMFSQIKSMCNGDKRILLDKCERRLTPYYNEEKLQARNFQKERQRKLCIYRFNVTALWPCSCLMSWIWKVNLIL